jgi:hypothetical protein
MSNRLSALLLVALSGWCCDALAAEVPAPARRSTPTSVQFKIRICEGKDELRFWFNEEAKEHWNTCKLPVPNVPVFLITESGTRGEGKTDRDGIAKLPQVALAPNETFRMAMACTTHRCFSLHGLFVGAPDIKSGANTMYAETVVRTDPSSK